MIKTLLGSVREYRTPSVLSPIFVSLEVVLECIIPYIMAQLIDEIYNGHINIILTYGFILVGMAFVSLLCGALAGKYCSVAAVGFAKNLRHDLYAKVQTFSFSNIDKFSSSSLVTRLTTDVNNVQNAYMMIIRIAVRAPLMLIFSLAMAIAVNAKMSLVFAVLIPLLGVAMYALIRKVYPMFSRVFDKYDDVNNSVQENVKAVRVVKAYVREDFEKKKFADRAEELKKDFTRAETTIALANPIMTFCMYAAVLVLAGWGAHIVVKTFGGFDAEGNPVWGSLSTGGLSSLITYSIQILSSLMMLSMILVNIAMSRASSERIAEVLDETAAIVNPENPVTEVKNGDVDFCGVSFKYSEAAEKYSLFGIDLHIKSGETVGVLGGTGSGKTSLIQLIPRLYDAAEGTVKVGGVDVKDYDLTALRNAVSVVLQKNELFGGTVKENLRWGNEQAADEEIIAAATAAEAHGFVSAMPNGYDSRIEQGGVNVSGGQKQRLCIARALLKKPKVLIFDDSTSAVDTATDFRIRAALRKAVPGTTKIIIAQRVASVMDADKIVVLDNGTIAAVGTHEQLLKTCAVYREVYDTQTGQVKAADHAE